LSGRSDGVIRLTYPTSGEETLKKICIGIKGITKIGELVEKLGDQLLYQLANLRDTLIKVLATGSWV
jgi:hypothetical protein